MKGIIVFYINFHPDNGQDAQSSVDVMMRCNKEVIDKINSDGEYRVMVVPTTKEACRVEKIDFDMAFPRYTSKTHFDIHEDEQRKRDRERYRQLRIEERAKQNKEE